MQRRSESWRFWLPVVFLLLFAGYSGQGLVRAHVSPKVDAPKYDFTQKLQARRGSVYAKSGVGSDAYYPFVKSVPFWEYRLDPVALTNGVVRRRGEPPRPPEAIARTIADALHLNYHRVLAMAANSRNRYQFLARSSDPDVHRILADSHLVRGVAIGDCQVRHYPDGRRLAHVLGSVNDEGVGSSGIEQRFNRELTGTPGVVSGMRDARGSELYDKRQVSIDPIPGADIYLTVNQDLQFEAENALKWGLGEFGADSGWCLVMDSRTGAVLSMASLPDFDPLRFGRASDDEKLNRAIAFNYEPGSVMKVITVAAAVDAGFTTVQTRYRTNRDDPGYYRLPGDGSHVWEPTMTVGDAIVHSSNIVIGKLGYDFGPRNLHACMRRFGFGSRTGIDLPGEQAGILPDPNRQMWDLASRSRAAIGQFVAVTAVQLAGAYQAIANDGVRMRPHVVDRVVGADGVEQYRAEPVPLGRAISARTAGVMRQVMLGVASPEGTARRAAIRGYSVAGKTGTAQKARNGRYIEGLYRASFCGIVPSGTVPGHDPRLVVLVTLDFNQRTKFHQGGNSAGPVFKRIALSALRYLEIPPDRPDELLAYQDDDEFDKVMLERERRYALPSAD